MGYVPTPNAKPVWESNAPHAENRPRIGFGPIHSGSQRDYSGEQSGNPELQTPTLTGLSSQAQHFIGNYLLYTNLVHPSDPKHPDHPDNPANQPTPAQAEHLSRYMSRSQRRQQNTEELNADGIPTPRQIIGEGAKQGLKWGINRYAPQSRLNQRIQGQEQAQEHTALDDMQLLHDKFPNFGKGATELGKMAAAQKKLSPAEQLPF